LHNFPYYLECIFWDKQAWKGEWHSDIRRKGCTEQKSWKPLVYIH